MTTAHDALTQHIDTFVAAFNAGDLRALDDTYETGGVLVPQPGHPVGGAERSAANAHLVGLGLPMRAVLRHSYVAGDVALLVVDWSLGGPEAPMRGTATDVVRRGPDERWRYVIDNPFGAV